MPYILSPEQKVVVDALLSNETSSTKYFDIVAALQAMSKACSSALRDHKKVMIHIPDQDIKKTVSKILSLNGLEDLAIDISSKDPIPELDIIKLRSTYKKEKDIPSLIEFVLSSKKQERQFNDLSNYYKALDKPVMTDIPFRDFATNIIYNKNKDRLKITTSEKSSNIANFTASEFYKVKKEIQTAVNLYKKEYELFDHLSLFNKSVWEEIDEVKIQKIKNQLILFRKESNALSKDFVKTSNELFRSSSKHLKDDFAKLKEQFIYHQEACIAYHIKVSAENEKKSGGFTIFKKKKNQALNKIYIDAFDALSGLIQKISNDWYNELDAPRTEQITYDYILKFIEINEKKSPEFENKLTKNLEQSVQRINKINTSSADVVLLDSRLENLIKEMNESELFDLELDHNILSFLKQSELCQRIAEYIEKCHILFHSSSPYLEWKSFFNASSPVFNFLFDELKKLPLNSWNDAFENWFEKKLINKMFGDIDFSFDELNNYYKQAKSSNQTEILALEAQIHSQRIQGIETLKSKSKELYNTLFKKKQLPSESWQNIVLINRSFMQFVFPIHLSETLMHSKEYDLVISFSRKNEEDISNVHYFAPISSDDIQNMSDNKDNFLYLNEYKYKGLLNNLSSTDKLKASKKLAKFILSLNQNIKIYQLKNANIISLCPSYDDAKLEQELDRLNAKVIDTNGVLYDRLTESILFTERKPFLVIKDELINSELFEHMLWQLKIQDIFKDAGYQIYSINTSEQLKDNQCQFDDLLSKINWNHPKEKDIKVPISKEFEKHQEEA